MTYREMAERLGVPFCGGECGIVTRSHDTGFVFLTVVHFAERRFTRRGAKNFLFIAARRERQLDQQWLNEPQWDWMYLHEDSVRAQEMAGLLGFRIPSHLFDQERETCRMLARRRGVKLSKYPAIASWVRR